VGDEDPELAFGCLAEDDTPGGSNESCHGGDSRCASLYPSKRSTCSFISTGTAAVTSMLTDPQD
jgi:hypothetical protein